MFISMSAIRSDQYLMLNCGVSIFTLLPPDPKMLARFPPAAFPPTSLPRPVAGGGGGGGGRDGGGGGWVEHSLHQKMFSQTSRHCCVGVLVHLVRGTSSNFSHIIPIFIKKKQITAACYEWLSEVRMIWSFSLQLCWGTVRHFSLNYYHYYNCYNHHYQYYLPGDSPTLLCRHSSTDLPGYSLAFLSGNLTTILNRDGATALSRDQLTWLSRYLVTPRHLLSPFSFPSSCYSH